MSCLGSAGSMGWVADSSGWVWALVIAAAVTSAVIDLRRRRIPNALTGPLLLGGLVWGILCSAGMVRASSAAVSGGLGDSLLGTLVAGLPFFILWIARGSGAGDAKLMMAIGAWLGMKAGLLVLVCTALSGGVLGIAWALAEGRLRATVANLPRAATDLVYLARGPGALAARRELVLATAAVRGAGSTQAEPAQAAQAAPRAKTKLPYGAAICVGTCVAAVRVFLL